jgi:signal peptidase II
MTKRLKNPLFWICAIIGLILDQFTKYLVLQNFQLYDTLAVFPGIFHLTYVRNRGAAFSLFEGAIWLRWLSLIVSLGLIALACFGPKLNTFEQLGWGFILGGAVGNGIDRFINNGEVVDFLQFPFVKVPMLVGFFQFQLQPFAVFNLADVFINIGIICLLIAFFRHHPETPNSRNR